MTFKKISPLAATVILLGTITLLNLFIIGRLGLSVDEAHYALYGKYLALSYFDHPPMVGWLYGVIELFSSSDFALRLWPIIFNVLTSLTLYYLSQSIFPNHTRWLCFLSVLLMQSAIMLHVLSIALLPQVPFLLFGLWSIIFFDRILRFKKTADFVGLGLSLGLAGLSEYTAILLVIAGVGFIFYKDKKILISLRFMFSLFIAGLMVIPVFYWNAEHDWLSFNYQINHVAYDVSWSLFKCLASSLSMSLSYSPVIYFLGLWVLFRQGVNNLFCFSALVLLLFFVYGSGFTPTLPHWVALAWLLLMPFIAAQLVVNFNKKSVKTLLYGSLIYSGLMMIVLYGLVFYPPAFLPLDYQPLKDLYGWKIASQVALEEQAHDKSQGFFVGNQWLASRLTWYTNSSVQIIGNPRPNQFSLWFDHPKANAHGILVVPYGANKPLEHSNELLTFKSCKWIRAITVYIAGGAQFISTSRRTLELSKNQIRASDSTHHRKVNAFDFYQCEGYLG